MERIALVTGGTRGLGLAIAEALREAGCRVAATYHHDEAGARRMAQETGIAVYRWDVADAAASRDGVARVGAELGPVDILVNNAGITADAMFHKMSEEQWWRVMHTNLGSMFNVTRQVIEGMRERRFGRIVNISSVNGRKGQAGQCNYAAAKAGILGFTKALALENAARSVTVNAVAPGYCDTAMVAEVRPELLQAIVAAIPVGRLGAPADIGRMVAFLAGKDAGFITGATFDVNGGQYLA
ncbi:acetoacetyl-CoA reductase [Massilia sp. 9I]|uniref:acetoacetyl-CoA reductase n=1 Tax=Massilia sp. 9I TaxID=2653152 RepID=UPI0012EFB1BB|nr:acetoacetyl-CoA reductase [Massilia sp. 9I]VXB98654.1 Acetoacetyl-CoA reductase [Massilia sp. 9I]